MKYLPPLHARESRRGGIADVELLMNDQNKKDRPRACF